MRASSSVPQYVALYRAMRPHGFTAADVGKLIYDLAASSLAKQADGLRHNGERFFTPAYFALLQDWATRSQERRYPMDWVQTVFRGDGTEFDIGVDYVECGLVKYFAAQGRSRARSLSLPHRLSHRPGGRDRPRAHHHTRHGRTQVRFPL